MSNDTISIKIEPTRTSKFNVILRQGDRTLYRDAFNINDARKRAGFIQLVIKDHPGLDADDIEHKMLVELDRLTSRVPDDRQQESAEDLLCKMSDSVRKEADSLLKSGHLIEHAYKDAEAVGIAGEEITVVTLYLAGVSRLLDRPLSVIVQGSSSSGKSYSIETVAELFPPEEKLVAHQMTSQALFHLPPGSLEHKIIVGGERSRLENDDRAEATRAMREMISSGCLKKLMPEKTTGGEIVTRQVEQDGPISFWESTTLGQIFEEDRNRCIVIHTDESENQTRRIMKLVASNGNTTASDDAIQRQWAIQRLLKKQDVVIPYAKRLTEHVPASKVEARRAFPMLLTVIKASALLNQYQRESDNAGRLIASEDDYATAYHVMNQPMAEQLGGGVSAVAAQYCKYLDRAMGNETFNVQDILNRGDNPKGRDRTYSLIKELANSNYLEVVDCPGRANCYRVVGSPASSSVCLPTPEEFFSNTDQIVGLNIERAVSPVEQVF